MYKQKILLLNELFSEINLIVHHCLFQDVGYKIAILEIVNSNLINLSQDAFKNIDPESIDLTYNHISVINVNAFRSVQVFKNCSI